MSLRRLLAITIISASCFPVTASAKDCDAILAAGLHNKYSFSDNSSFDKAIHNAICSNRSSRSDNSSSFGVNIPIPEIGSMLGFNASSGNARQKVDEYCSTFSDTVNRQAAINWSRSVVDPNVVRAWESCAAEKGFLCQAETLSDTKFQITLSWKRTNVGVGTEKISLTSVPSMVNATCPNGTIPQGLEIPDDSAHSAVCDFSTANQDAFVILNSTQGPTTCMAVAPLPPTPPKSHLASCLAGQELGCVSLFQDAGFAEQACNEIQKMSAPDADNELAPQLRSQLGFFAYNRCGNLQTSVISVRSLTDKMQETCFAATVNTQSCNQAKDQLKLGVAGYFDTIDELVKFDLNDPATSLANVGNPF